MLKLFILPVSVLSYTFFKKGRKSHMASYLVTIATDFRKKCPCEKKKNRQRKEKRRTDHGLTLPSPYVRVRV